VDIPVQVDGKVRGTVTVGRDAEQEAVLGLAMTQPTVIDVLSGGSPHKVIYVPGRITRFVAAAGVPPRARVRRGVAEPEPTLTEFPSVAPPRWLPSRSCHSRTFRARNQQLAWGASQARARG
jgi:hypothetical protein